MKIIRITSFVLLLVMISTVACKDEFLDISPTASLSNTELSSKLGIEGSLVGAYSMLIGRDGFYSDLSNWFWGSVRGLEANKGSNDGDQSQVNEIFRFAPQTNNGEVLAKYARLYEGIVRANLTLSLVSTAQGVAKSELKIIAGEARFLRGLYYLDLKKIYGNTPYVDETWDEIVPIPNDQDLLPFIINDFKAAYDSLGDNATNNDVGRANKWAARAFHGKALLFAGNFAGAKAAFDDVIANGRTANGTPYALVADYKDLFRSTTESNSEVVFAVEAAAGTGSISNANPAMVLNFPHGAAGPNRPGGCCGFNQPTFSLVNSFRTVGGLPILDGSHNSATNRIASDIGLESAAAFTPDAGTVDPRLDHSVGRRGIPYLDWGPHPGKDWIRDQAYGGPYSPKKFVYYQAGSGVENDVSSWTPGYTAVNYNAMRYADLLLLAAEAEIEAGTVAKAMEYVNLVRARANASRVQNGAVDAANYNVALYTGATFTAANARDAVRMERKLELSGEGHRFFDLVRWGIVKTAVNSAIAHESTLLPTLFGNATFADNQDEYLPIPQSEIDFFGKDVLTQNKGY